MLIFYTYTDIFIPLLIYFFSMSSVDVQSPVVELQVVVCSRDGTSPLPEAELGPPSQDQSFLHGAKVRTECRETFMTWLREQDPEAAISTPGSPLMFVTMRKNVADRLLRLTDDSLASLGVSSCSPNDLDYKLDPLDPNDCDPVEESSH